MRFLMKMRGWKRVLQSSEVGAVDVLIFPKRYFVQYKHITCVVCELPCSSNGGKKFNLCN